MKYRSAKAVRFQLLGKWLESLAHVFRHDPHAPITNDPLEEAVSGADAVIIATNHDEFAAPRTLTCIVERAGNDCLMVDPWNVLGYARVFATAGEVTSLAREGALEPAAGLPIE